MNTPHHTPNLAFYLPYGELLRTFLDAGFISAKDLREVLRKRGVFLRDYIKENSIPHLALATVTPVEFEYLLGLQSQREDSSKTVSETVEWTSKRTVMEAFPASIDISKVFDKNSSSKINNLTTAQMVAGNPNHVRVEFEIERSNLHQSWHVDKTPHIGSIEIQKTDTGNEATIEITSTIAETKIAGRKIVKNVQDNLKLSGDIPVTAKRKKVQFCSFTNDERIKFLLDLTGTGSRELVFSAVTDSSIFPDRKMDLPDELKKYFNKINKANLEGDELQGCIFLNEDEYRLYIILSRIVVKYDFEYFSGKGSCTVEYKFEGYPKSKGDHDFIINPTNFVFDEASTPNRAAARKYVESLIRDLARTKCKPFASIVTDQPISEESAPKGRKPSKKKALHSNPNPVLAAAASFEA